MLASRVIAECQSIKGVVTSYFYCKDGDLRKNNCLAILKGLLTHMIRQFRSLVPYCIDKAHSNGQRELSSTLTAKSVLEVFCDEIPKQFIIVDGLDECGVKERSLLLSDLAEIIDRCDARDPGKIRLLIVSQDFTDIKGSLSASQSEMTTLRLTESDNRHEIECFVRRQIERMPSNFDLDDAEKRYIWDMTCMRSNGRHAIRNCRSLTFVRNVLVRRARDRKSLPTGPSYRPCEGASERHLSAWTSSCVRELQSLRRRETELIWTRYERIVCRMVRQLSPSQWKHAQKLLGWIVCAKRPLMWYEIQCAISMEPNHQVIDIQTMGLVHHIRDLCGSLVRELPGGRLELVHSTARQ